MGSCAHNAHLLSSCSIAGNAGHQLHFGGSCITVSGSAAPTCHTGWDVVHWRLQALRLMYFSVLLDPALSCSSHVDSSTFFTLSFHSALLGRLCSKSKADGSLYFVNSEWTCQTQLHASSPFMTNYRWMTAYSRESS